MVWFTLPFKSGLRTAGSSMNKEISDEDDSYCDVENPSLNTISPLRTMFSFQSKFIVSLDCEMVGVGYRNQSALARCSIVDYSGDVIYNSYILPSLTITNYRYQYSGIQPAHMKHAVPYRQAREDIIKVLQGRIIVGHALDLDFRCLELEWDPSLVRDTSKFPGLRTMAGLPEQRTPSLKVLSRILLGRVIQQGNHCSLEDCRSALDLYKICEVEWEESSSCSSFLCDEFWDHILY